MDSKIDLASFGLEAGQRVMLVDDDWNLMGNDVFVVDVEPVPGSTQCVIRCGREVRTVARSELRPT